MRRILSGAALRTGSALLDAARLGIGRRRPGALAAVVCAALFTAAGGARAHAAEEVMGRRCVMCHITGSAEIMAGEETFYVPSGIEREQGAETMCYSCHNGSVMDSRANVWTGHQHPTGAKAGPGVKIPKGFPLTEDKKLFCGTCHSPHEPDIMIEGRVVSNMRAPAGTDDFCVKCHTTERKGGHRLGELETAIPMKMILSGGLAGEKRNKLSCRTCHLPHGSVEKELLTRPKDAICEDCHGRNPSKEGIGPGMDSHPIGVETTNKTLRKRLPDGKKLSSGPDAKVICLTCHKTHRPGVGESLLVADNAAGKLCAHCHDDHRGEGAKKDNNGNHPFVASAGRGAETAQGCNICHRTHNGARDPFAEPGKSQLLTASMADSRLCVNCHEDLAAFGIDEARAKGTHPLGVWADVRKSTGPGEGSATEREKLSCRGCHLSHGAEPGFSSLREHRSFSCLLCHSDQNSLDENASPPGNHPVYVRPGAGSIPEQFLLAGAAVGEYGEIVCATCHGVHRAEKDTPLLLEPTAQKDYCVECHPGKTLLFGSGHDLRNSAPDAPNKFAERPMESGACGVCHRAHGWARDPGKGADEISRICSDCHYDGGSIADPVGAHSHPVGCDMRDRPNLFGLPLFSVNGERDVSGEVTCATCHDVHRETIPRLAHEADHEADHTRGASHAGSEEHFLRLPYRGTDVMCLNCHEEKAALGSTPHDLKNAEPARGGAHAAERGSCAHCHSPHNGLGNMMWAIETPDLGDSGDLVTTLCSSCHSPEGIAGKKTPRHSHPTNVSIPTDMDTNLPLYDSRGTESPQGLMTCATCHDVHREAGSLYSKASEAATSHSFLRETTDRDASGALDDVSSLCIHCHDEEQSVLGTPHDLRKGTCGGCHEPHSDTPALMWADDLGEGGDAASEACLGCHPSSAGESGAYTHPVGVTPRADVATGLPLFDKLGSRDPQGMVTCASCHDAHAKNRNTDAATPAEEEKFQRVTGSGDLLCMECHPEKANIIGTVHDTAKAGSGQGVCGACHAAHHAKNEPALWTGEYGVGRDLPSRYCLGCHAESGAAKDAVPEKLWHPKTKGVATEPVESEEEKSFGSVLKGVLVGPTAPARNAPTQYVMKTMKLVDRVSVSKKKPPLLPLYDDTGRPGNSGIISCPSCHDIHDGGAKIREAIFKDDAERERMEKGLIRTNFVDEATRLCGDCHGAYRVSVFWGFHGEARGKSNPYLYRGD